MCTFQFVEKKNEKKHSSCPQSSAVRPILGEWKRVRLHCNTYSNVRPKQWKVKAILSHSSDTDACWEKRCRTMSFVLMAVIHPWNNTVYLTTIVYLTTDLLTSHPEADQHKSGLALCSDILPVSKGWNIRQFQSSVLPEMRNQHGPCCFAFFFK